MWASAEVRGSAPRVGAGGGRTPLGEEATATARAEAVVGESATRAETKIKSAYARQKSRTTASKTHRRSCRGVLGAVATPHLLKRPARPAQLPVFGRRRGIRGRPTRTRERRGRACRGRIARMRRRQRAHEHRRTGGLLSLRRCLGLLLGPHGLLVPKVHRLRGRNSSQPLGPAGAASVRTLSAGVDTHVRAQRPLKSAPPAARNAPRAGNKVRKVREWLIAGGRFARTSARLRRRSSGDPGACACRFGHRCGPSESGCGGEEG